jgi:hypothetical protein
MFLPRCAGAVLPELVAYLQATGQTVPPELAQRASGREPRETTRYAKK